MAKLEIEGLIRKYNITDAGNGQLKIQFPKGHKPTSAEINKIKAAKPEILAYWAELKTAAEMRRQKVASIEGLEAIREALDAEEDYARAFNRMMEDEGNDGANPPSRPSVSSKDLKAQYPRAAAYLKAEAWEMANHYAKSSAGMKAKERIINGEDYRKALADMEAEWTAHCNEHIWD